VSTNGIGGHHRQPRLTDKQGGMAGRSPSINDTEVASGRVVVDIGQARRINPRNRVASHVCVGVDPPPRQPDGVALGKEAADRVRENRRNQAVSAAAINDLPGREGGA
jgi:hypothetical protein